MKALVLKRYGGAKNVEFADLPRPTVKPDEILVRVHAAGLNPIDNMIPMGSFKPIIQLQLPATVGSDLAGVVVDIGSRVTRFKVGDAVFASTFDLGVGALAEYAAVPERAAALKPDKLDFVQAASIPMVGLTSWQALVERAQLQPGQKVFVPAGAGGIGLHNAAIWWRWLEESAAGILQWNRWREMSRRGLHQVAIHRVPQPPAVTLLKCLRAIRPDCRLSMDVRSWHTLIHF